jgi:hypothetical protein
MQEQWINVIFSYLTSGFKFDIIIIKWVAWEAAKLCLKFYPELRAAHRQENIWIFCGMMNERIRNERKKVSKKVRQCTLVFNLKSIIHLISLIRYYVVFLLPSSSSSFHLLLRAWFSREIFIPCKKVSSTNKWFTCSSGEGSKANKTDDNCRGCGAKEARWKVKVPHDRWNGRKKNNQPY